MVNLSPPPPPTPNPTDPEVEQLGQTSEFTVVFRQPGDSRNPASDRVIVITERQGADGGVQVHRVLGNDEADVLHTSEVF